MSSKSLEQYLKNNQQSNDEHRLKATIHGDGTITFYIHPHGQSGETVDFIVKENNLQKAIRIINNQE